MATTNHDNGKRIAPADPAQPPADPRLPRQGTAAVASGGDDDGSSEATRAAAAEAAKTRDEPPDEGAIESLGRAISDVITGAAEDAGGRDPKGPGGVGHRR